jgi:hypothetical protein
MADNRKRDPAGQVLCFGQSGNHAPLSPPDDPSKTLIICIREIADDPRFHFRVALARIGKPCIQFNPGAVAEFRPSTGSAVLPRPRTGWFHTESIQLVRGEHADDPRGHSIIARPKDGGGIGLAYQLDGLSPGEAAEFIATWRHGFTKLEARRPAHRPKGSTAVTRERWDQVLAEVAPRYKRRDERIAAMARKLPADKSTVRRYVNDRQWPI